MSETRSRYTHATNKVLHTLKMALYAAIGAEFKSSILKEFDSLLDERIRAVITQTLKQVAHDYSLNYKELKVKYCSKESLSEYDVPGGTQVVSVDLEVDTVEPVPKSKSKKPSVKRAASEQGDKLLALSKMKKADLVEECERRGLDSEGTIPQLKERVKEARSGDEPVKEPKAKPPKEPKAKAKPPKEPKAPKVKEPEAVAKPPPPSLEEEDFEPVCRKCPDEEEEDDIEEEEEDIEVEDELGDEDVEDRQTRLRKILASYGEQLDEDDEFADA